MNKFKTRHLIGIGLALSLLALNFLFAFISVPILVVVYIDYKLSNIRKKENVVEEVPQEEENIDSIRALVEKVEQEKQKWIEYRQNVDLRQFKGRNDVTKEEVEDYLWYHKVWEGYQEKWIILDEIMKVCNINEDDCKEIMYEHYHHKGNDGSVGGGHWIRNEETKRIIEYERKKNNEKEKEFDKIYDLDKIFDFDSDFKKMLEINKYENERKAKESKYWYINHYEEWLKERGYSKC